MNEPVLRTIAGTRDGAKLYRVTIKFLDGSTEVITLVTSVDRVGSVVDIRYGEFSATILDLANVQSVSAVAEIDLALAEPDAPEYVRCGNRGPRVGENTAWCGKSSGHTDACRDAGLGVAW